MGTTLEFDEDEVVALTKLLVGAAHADGDFHGLERRRIKELVKPYIDNRDLANRVAERVVDFDPDAFSVSDCVTALNVSVPEERGPVLAMIADVLDADFTHDFAESDYLETVADALGAEPEEYEDHTVEIIEE